MRKFSAGLISGAVMLLAGMLSGRVFELLFPSLKLEYMNPGLFRPWSDPIMSIFFFVPFINGLILAWLWAKTKSLFKDKSDSVNGINFGLTYWFITIPGMFMSYSSFPVSFTMVCSWSFGSLLQYILTGMIVSKMISK